MDSNARHMSDVVGTRDIVFVTLDTLRFDVADREFRLGHLPNFSTFMGKAFERRHTPGTFTYAAHHAFFAGFLPTPALPGRHPRLFAARFAGSETTTTDTAVFDQADIVAGFRAAGYRSLCVGGVGFFNQKTPLGCVLPSLFDEAVWREELGVTSQNSTFMQFSEAARWVERLEKDQRFFLFINVSAIHQPNQHYLDGVSEDCLESHAAALRYVDHCLPILMSALARRACFCIVCSDHGTAYGEDGFEGHRVAHPTVTDVPYADFFYPRTPQGACP